MNSKNNNSNFKNSRWREEFNHHPSRKRTAKQNRQAKPGDGKALGKRRQKRKSVEIAKAKVQNVLLACFILLTVGYIGGAIYFSNHFFFNTRINGQNFSLSTVAEAQSRLMNYIEQYQLKITDLDEGVHVIRGEDISLTYKGGYKIYELLRQQNDLRWPASLLTANHTEIAFQLEFDGGLLEQKIRGLPFIATEQIMPICAYPVFNGNKFVIEPETPGTAMDLNKLITSISQSIQLLEEELCLYEIDAFIKPKTTANCPLLAAKVDNLNRYLAARITYNMREQVVVDGGLIYTWLEIDNEFNVTLVEERVSQWVADFAIRFNTRGTTRSIVTPRGRVTQVTGGTYGWWINEEETTYALISHIQAGDTLYKEPVYFINGTAAEHSYTDWGDTFIQVDLTKQHMWYIVNGQVVFETPVITGLPYRSPTPQGVYFVLYTRQDYVLRGPHNPETGRYEWEQFVSYWMPITWCGIGFHDATWQRYGFGGQLYRTLGSRGCINMSLSAAAELFNMITTFTPVVVHY